MKIDTHSWNKAIDAALKLCGDATPEKVKQAINGLKR